MCNYHSKKQIGIPAFQTLHCSAVYHPARSWSQYMVGYGRYGYTTRHGHPAPTMEASKSTWFDMYIPKRKAAFRAPCYHIDIFMSLTLKQTWLGNAGKVHVLIILILSQKKWSKNFPIYPTQRLVNVPFWGFASHITFRPICWRLHPQLDIFQPPKYSWISSNHGFSSDESFRKSQSSVRGVHRQSVVGFPVNGSRDVPYLQRRSPSTQTYQERQIKTSGNLLHSYWKWPFIVLLPIQNGDFP